MLPEWNCLTYTPSYSLQKNSIVCQQPIDSWPQYSAPHWRNYNMFAFQSIPLLCKSTHSPPVADRGSSKGPRICCHMEHFCAGYQTQAKPNKPYSLYIVYQQRWRHNCLLHIHVLVYYIHVYMYMYMYMLDYNHYYTPGGRKYRLHN